MSVAQKFYTTLVDILCEVGDLEAQAGLLQADRVIARRFGVSESTTRNWRRGTNTLIAANTIQMIILLCEQIAPQRVADLEFISRLARGVPDVKLAAERIVNTLSEQVFTNGADWHIYSGPLKMAHDPGADPLVQVQLMHQASLVVERILETGIDQTDIPCIGELIRYSAHGWFLRGFLKTRELSLSSPLGSTLIAAIDPLEAVLYIADGCASPAISAGRLGRAKAYVEQALALLQQINLSVARHSDVSLSDAFSIIRSFQVGIACLENPHEDRAVLAQFAQDYAHGSCENEWIESIKQEALGSLMLVQKQYAAATYHYGQATYLKDCWVTRLGLPFCVTAPHFLSGYARLQYEGPTESVKAQIEEGLLKTLDFGAVNDQIKGRLCYAAFYDKCEDWQTAQFHRRKARETAIHHGLIEWYGLITRMIA